MALFERYERRIPQIHAGAGPVRHRSRSKKPKQLCRRQGRRRLRHRQGHPAHLLRERVLGLHPRAPPSRIKKGQKKARRHRHVARRGPAGLLHPRLGRRRPQGRPRPRQPGRACCCTEETQVLRLPGRPRVLRRRRGRHRPRPERQQGPQGAAARDPERPRQGRRPDHQPHQRLHLRADASSTTPPASSASCGRSPTRRASAAKVRCYGADDVREGVAINHHEGVDVSITGNSTNPTRFQHPVAGTYKKECIEQGKKYFSVASRRRHRPHPAPRQHGRRSRHPTA